MTREEAESLQPGDIIEYSLSKSRYRVTGIAREKGKVRGILAVPIPNDAPIELPMGSIQMLNKVAS